MKMCYRCKEVKPLTLFYRNKTQPDGYAGCCKMCSGKERRAAPSYAGNLRLKALEVLGGKCEECGFTDPRALQIDHVNGGGCQERKKETSNKPKALYRRISEGSKEEFFGLYQVLCANCNCIKRIENNENGRYEDGQYAHTRIEGGQ